MGEPADGVGSNSDATTGEGTTKLSFLIGVLSIGILEFVPIPVVHNTTAVLLEQEVIAELEIYK